MAPRSADFRERRMRVELADALHGEPRLQPGLDDDPVGARPPALKRDTGGGDPSGLTTARPPRVGRSPQRLAFFVPSRPRPCGEMTSGRIGFRPGPYPLGSRTVAWLVRPSKAR